MAKWKEKESKIGFNALAVLAIAAVLVIGAAFVAFKPQVLPQPFEQGADNLLRFQSYSELAAYFANAASSGRSYGLYDGMAKGIISTGALPSMATGAAETGASSQPSYSGTNVQVAGVDEADIIKTDGKYAYTVSGGKISIILAYPAEEMKVLSTITFGQDLSPRDIFVSGDKLVVFSEKRAYYPRYYMAEAKIAVPPIGGESSGEDAPKCGNTKCFGYNTGTVSVMLYSISDRSSPALEKELEFEGSYLNSRLIGENAYFVVNSYPRYGIYEAYDADTNTAYENKDIIPLMRADGIAEKIASAEQIGYIPNVVPETFVTVASLNLLTQEMNKETVVASGSNLYASQNSLYLADSVWHYNGGDVPLPMPLEIMRSIFVPNWGSVSKTSISRFTLDNGKISFAGQGIVPGTILNQFSMDEYNGNFRLATTVGDVWGTGENVSRNNVYVLGPDMNIVGSLEDLAPGEKIYSARFMGPKCYLVTFKKVDPLFVIDVSDPAAPKVLGKLKIPGYSDYLHPIDDTHIIGIGKEAVESTYGTFAWYQGMKMAIFDVSDVANPKEMHKITIGDRGTDSYALHDHKAFLFDKEKQLLVLPILLAEIPAENKEPAEGPIESPQYGEYTYQGAFVYNVSIEGGFTERGRITHVSAQDELKRGYYFDDLYSVKRSFYIGSNLYTFSDNMLKASDLASLAQISAADLNVSPN